MSIDKAVELIVFFSALFFLLGIVAGLMWATYAHETPKLAVSAERKAREDAKRAKLSRGSAVTRV